MDEITRLEEISDEIECLLGEAMDCLRATGRRELVSQARAYWFAHIMTALRNETEFIGKSMVTLEDTIAELKEGNE